MGGGEGEFERNFSSELVTHLLNHWWETQLASNANRRGRRSPQQAPGDMGCELWTLSHLGKPRSGLLSGNTVKRIFWKPIKYWSSGHERVSHLVNISTNHGLQGFGCGWDRDGGME